MPRVLQRLVPRVGQKNEPIRKKKCERSDGPAGDGAMSDWIAAGVCVGVLVAYLLLSGGAW